MTTRYEVMTPRTSLPHDSHILDLVPPELTNPRGDNDSSDKYCEETDTPCPFPELLEHFWQLLDQSTSLKSTTPQSTPMSELMQLTDKLSLTMMLQLHSAPSLMRNHCTKQAGIHRHIECNTKRIKPHHDCGISPHSMDKTLRARGLVHGHRNCHKTSNRDLPMSS